MAWNRKKGTEFPLISIVIPSRNCAPALKRCLESIRAQDYHSYEIIVVDGNSSDNTAQIARQYSDRVIETDISVPASRNEGFRNAIGQIFLSMDSDMVMEDGLLRDISICMGSHSSLIVPELGTGNGLIARCKALEKLCYLGDTGIESSRAFSRAAFLSSGGYDAALLFGEDRDLHCRVEKTGTASRTNRRFFHDAGGLSLSGCLKKAFRYGRSSRAFFAKKHPGSEKASSPLRLLFPGKFHVLAGEPLTAVCLVALKTAESSAFLLGYLYSYIRQ